MIGIIDYGFGNVASVKNAFNFLGYEAEIFEDRHKILSYSKIILPGVGAFADAIEALKQTEFHKAIDEYIATNKQILGICVGMQLMFEKSMENGEYQGLSLLKGNIIKIDADIKIPHVGWNSLKTKKESKIYQGIGENPYVYFVHSYHLETCQSIVNATTFYGKELQVSVEKDNIFGLQFHPEKSGEVGLKILDNFAKM